MQNPIEIIELFSTKLKNLKIDHAEDIIKKYRCRSVTQLFSNLGIPLERQTSVIESEIMLGKREIVNAVLQKPISNLLSAVDPRKALFLRKYILPNKPANLVKKNKDGPIKLESFFTSFQRAGIISRSKTSVRPCNAIQKIVRRNKRAQIEQNNRKIIITGSGVKLNDIERLSPKMSSGRRKGFENDENTPKYETPEKLEHRTFFQREVVSTYSKRLAFLDWRDNDVIDYATPTKVKVRDLI